MYRNILVGADDSSTARRAVETAADLAQVTGASLHIVTAYEPGSVRPVDLPEEMRYTVDSNPADALLRELTTIAGRRSLEPVIHPATGTPADVIVAIAEREDVDLIVVGNKGMKGSRRVLGSVPNTIAHHAPCSVLIVDTASGA